MIISAPNVEEQAAVPASDLSFFYYNQSWDCTAERPSQVTTMDRTMLEKGSSSALITDDGKVIQISANGSRTLSSKKFDSSYDFIAGQMKGKDYADVLAGYSPKRRRTTWPVEKVPAGATAGSR